MEVFDFNPGKNVCLTMATEGYKKWVIITIFLIITGFVIFVLTDSFRRTGKPADETHKRTLQPGPLIDSGIKETVPLEQMEKQFESAESLARLGDTYFETNRFEKAIEVYEKVLKLDPGDVDTYNDLGLAFHYSGKSDIAVDTLKKGIEINPSYQRIRLSLGFVLASTGKNKEAKDALQKAKSLAPDSVVGREAERILGLLK